jgi:hypothetical protein
MIAEAAAPGFSPLLGSAFDGLFGWRVIFLVVAASGRRERYSRALARKDHGGPGLVEQDGGLFKSFDAAFDAKSNDEKNHGNVILQSKTYPPGQRWTVLDDHEQTPLAAPMRVPYRLTAGHLS